MSDRTYECNRCHHVYTRKYMNPNDEDICLWCMPKAALPNDDWHGITLGRSGFIIQHPMACDTRSCPVVKLVKMYDVIREQYGPLGLTPPPPP